MMAHVNRGRVRDRVARYWPDLTTSRSCAFSINMTQTVVNKDEHWCSSQPSS